MTKINVAVIVLTLLSYWSIINIVRLRYRKSFSVVLGSQSDVHNLTKRFSDVPTTKHKTSQMKKYEDRNRIDVLVIEEQAYWISNNVFYTGEIVDGQIDHETTKPINTENMQKDEIDKMLFIIDSLKDRNNNDFGGTRN